MAWNTGHNHPQFCQQRIGLCDMLQPLTVAVEIVIYYLGVWLLTLRNVRQQAGTTEQIYKRGTVRVTLQYLYKPFYKPPLLAHEGQNDYIQCLDEDTFFSTWYESSKLFRTNGEELSVDRLNDVIPFWTVCNGVPTSGYCGWKSSKGGYMTVFIPHDLSAACPLEIPSYVTNFIRDPHSYEDPSYEVYDGTSGDHWYLTPDKDGWNAVRNDGTVYRIPLRAQKIYLCGDRIIGVSDHASAMLDLEENVIFFYPLDAED